MCQQFNIQIFFWACPFPGFVQCWDRAVHYYLFVAQLFPAQTKRITVTIAHALRRVEPFHIQTSFPKPSNAPTLKLSNPQTLQLSNAQTHKLSNLATSCFVNSRLLNSLMFAEFVIDFPLFQSSYSEKINISISKLSK
ncbi:hypothetical protein SAMN04488097_2130 [Epilithonimonas lactis]|nr:hypothetical protein SAMN04488097_2130 [Epilithonimonas lactis]